MLSRYINLLHIDFQGTRSSLEILFNAYPWWCHQMETFSALMAIYRGIHRSPYNSPYKGQWRGALIFCLHDLRLNKRLNKQSSGWWLRRHRAHYEVTVMTCIHDSVGDTHILCIMTKTSWNGISCLILINDLSETLQEKTVEKSWMNPTLCLSMMWHHLTVVSSFVITGGI